MKKPRIITIITFLFVCVIIFTSCNPSDNNILTETDIQHFRDATTNVQNSWNQGDREPYVNRFSTDAIFMAPNMETVVGKDAIRTFANSFPELRIKFSIIEIKGSSMSAYVRGSFIVTSPADSLLDKGKYLSIWEKSTENQWQLTHDIFNSDMPLSVVRK